MDVWLVWYGTVARIVARTLQVKCSVREECLGGEYDDRGLQGVEAERNEYVDWKNGRERRVSRGNKGEMIFCFGCQLPAAR